MLSVVNVIVGGTLDAIGVAVAVAVAVAVLADVVNTILGATTVVRHYGMLGARVVDGLCGAIPHNH